jgi:hypothetical protein
MPGLGETDRPVSRGHRRAAAAIAGPGAGGDDGRVAVLAALAVVAVWRYAVKGKGAVSGRLAAVLCAVIVVWLAVGLKDPAASGRAAGAFASGASAAVSALGQFVGLL